MIVSLASGLVQFVSVCRSASIRTCFLILLGAMVLWPRTSVAEPGNLTSWFSNSLNELTFTCQTAVVKLEMLDAGVARVRLSTNNVAFSTSPSFTIVRSWPRPLMSVTDGNPLIVSNAGLRVEVSKTPFRLTFKKADGTLLLSDGNSYGLDYRSTTRYANFFMPAGEQFYGLGMRFFKPLSHRNQTNYLYNARMQTGPGGPAVTDMAVPLLLSSKGYGLFMDNTFPQYWDFTTGAGPTNWLVRVDGGELNYYFFAGDSLADALGRYTQATGRAPVPPRWTFGYMQARNGYANWSELTTVRDSFRTNDLPCDAIFLDLQWFGSNTCYMGALDWYTNAFPNPVQNISTLASNGFKTVLIHEPYINSQNGLAKTNYDQGAALKYLMTDDYPSRSVPSTVNGFFCNAGYVDFNNPAARSWWFSKLMPHINEGNAGQWADLGEPENDDSTTLTDYSYDGRQEYELHNVYNLLWAQGLAEGYATNYPNQRLWIYARSGFAGDQRFGTAHWSNDVGTDWNTFNAHLNAMADFSLSGMSYYGSDIGGYWPVTTPNDELYVRWFEYGAFSPVFRGHGISEPGGVGYKAVAPYEFTNSFVSEICRIDMKVRYRLLPYIYTTARGTFDTGLPLCRPLTLVYPGDTTMQNDGSEFLFGPNLLVAPVTTQGAGSRSVYLPAGQWISHWNGQALTGPVTTNWPAPLTQIPLFYRDDSITPLGPYVSSTQFDDGSQRAVRVYCSSSASYTLYDDDGTSNDYRTNGFATTSITASSSGNVVDMEIGGASGSYSNQPSQRAWGLELYCTNAVSNVVADSANLTNLPNAAALSAATSGYYLDGAEKLLRIKLPSASITQAHSVVAYLNLSAPAPYEVRIKAVGIPYLDTNGVMWAADQAYSPGSFGYSGGTSNESTNAIAGTSDDILFQCERYGSPFSYLFDVPNGQYEIKLLDAETYNNNPGDRLINVFIEGQQVLTNFDILVAAGGKNKPVTLTFTNTVGDGQLAITFSGTPGLTDPNARVSAIAVRQIAAAGPGNLISWFSNSLDELTFTCQTAVVKLQMLDTGVARVRLTSNTGTFSTNSSFTIVRNWPLPPMSVTGTNPLVVSNADLRVEVSTTPFQLTFKKPDGTVLLTDVSTSGLDYGPDGSSANFVMPGGEQYYGLGLVNGKPLSYRNQHRTLYNAHPVFLSGWTADMAVPLVVSSKGYGVFVDNTYQQDWDFNKTGGTQWQVVVHGGELNYYVMGGNTPADVLDQYTQATGRAPLPPRWTLGYMQSRFGYRNWSEVFTAKDAFRTNDLPCDALILDLYWYGQTNQIGGVQWASNAFPNASANIASLAGAGIKIVPIHEPYINRDNEPAKTNFNQAAALHYLVATNLAMTSPSVHSDGFFGNIGYVDFLNPAARSWWFEKWRPIINNGIAGHWTDLGEPGGDNPTDYLFGGRREAEIHNVYNLLWHQGLAEAYATNYPNQRLWLLSRSGFAGDQRFGAAHWTGDAGADWNVLLAQQNALGDYGLSGMSYLGTDIGGWTGVPTDELYTRWFQFGAFCPVFRAHGYDSKPTAPYEFGIPVEENCRNMLKLRYRLLPYVYTTARETSDTGLPMCRALPLAFPGDPTTLNDGSEFMFGPNILVAPVATQGAISRSVYLPAGQWISHWNGQALTGPVTTNWPAPLTQIPLFYRDDSITPLGPYVSSTQFDDGSQRAVRVYCSSSASYTLYDDDGASNGYRTNGFATTSITADKSGNVVDMEISGASGSYSNQPSQRAWGLELYCTNAVFNVVADGAVLTNLPNATALSAATSGYYLDGAEKLLRIKLPSAAITQSHSVAAYLDIQAPAPYETRVKAVDRPYLDTSGVIWAQDRAYNPGSFGYTAGTTNESTNAIAGTSDDILFQCERYGSPFSYLFDAPNGQYEIRLLDAETYNNNPGDRLINVFINGQQVLTNFDILVAAGGKNKALTLTLTNAVASGQLAITFSATPGHPEPNARISAIAARKIADPNSVGDGIPDWWRAANFGGSGATTNSSSCAVCDPDGDGQMNLQEFRARTNPNNPNSALTATISGNITTGFMVTWPSVAGKMYRIYYSNDLQTWTPVVPDVPAASSLTQWTDPGPLPQQRFYKVGALL